MSTTSSGRKAEELAGLHLEQKGFVLIARNMRNEYGEIDLIAEHGDTVVFCEVKLRKSAGFARGLEHVDRRKQTRYLNASSLWLAGNRPEAQARFDVIEIYGDIDRPAAVRINHIENAFWGEFDV